MASAPAAYAPGAGRPAAASAADAAPPRIGRAATVALYDELALYPKPGLVSLVDSGSHADMDAATFLRSLFALRRYFVQIAAAGAADAPFDALERLGIAAERRMLQATGGVNTHRGAIFSLGLLCAAAGRLTGVRPHRALSPDGLRETLVGRWGAALRARCVSGRGAAELSNGQQAARRHGLAGVGAAAADGFPVLFDVAVPALRGARADGLDARRARLQTLFAIVAVLDDTNLAHRGGIDGLRHAQCAAARFLAAGGIGRTGGLAEAEAIHRDFVARRLSPGGGADVLAAACWIERVCAAA